MIVANLATYPPRRPTLRTVLEAISPQVDRVNVVLNEYGDVPEEAKGFDNVRPVIPDEDTKDAGKFYVAADHPDDIVLYIDDDVYYPSDYVERTVERFSALGDRGFLGGYHCSIYGRPTIDLRDARSVRAWLRYNLSPSHIARFRKIIHFGMHHRHPLYVDQVATNAAVIRAGDAPPYDYMRTSQKFVDVRLAKWCHECWIERVSLPREIAWLNVELYEETIIGGFTAHHPPHVAREIRSFALRSPRRGEPFDPALVR